MSPVRAAPGVAHSLRAQASRLNGARSRGPKTAPGKERSAQNALKHGLSAEKFALVGEDRDAFEMLEAALIDELAPEGALQALLVSRIARAAWRLERAERIEGELLDHHAVDGNLGLALVRDGHGSSAFDTLLRYRGTALNELWRALGLMKALQAQALHEAAAPQAILLDRRAAALRNEPETRTKPRLIAARPLQTN